MGTFAEEQIACVLSVGLVRGVPKDGSNGSCHRLCRGIHEGTDRIRLAHLRAPRLDDDPTHELSSIGAMAKCFATDTAMSVTTDAIQLVGGNGYTKDFPVERFMRDANITQMYEVTNQIPRVVVSKTLLALREMMTPRREHQ
jgi:alkylation response protein AidB-like acyl-CoA dehydrogenase